MIAAGTGRLCGNAERFCTGSREEMRQAPATDQVTGAFA